MLRYLGIFVVTWPLCLLAAWVLADAHSLPDWLAVLLLMNLPGGAIIATIESRQRIRENFGRLRGGRERASQADVRAQHAPAPDAPGVSGERRRLRLLVALFVLMVAVSSVVALNPAPGVVIWLLIWRLGPRSLRRSDPPPEPTTVGKDPPPRRATGIVVGLTLLIAAFVTIAATIGDWAPPPDDVQAMRDAGIPLTPIDPDIEHWKSGVRSLQQEMARLTRGPATTSSVARARQILEGVTTRVKLMEERGAPDADIVSVLVVRDAIKGHLRLMEAEAAAEGDGFKALDKEIEALDDAALIDRTVGKLQVLHDGLDYEVALRLSHEDTTALRSKIERIYSEVARTIAHIESRRMAHDLRLRVREEVLTYWDRLRQRVAALPE